jgi:hypothetical protein
MRIFAPSFLYRQRLAIYGLEEKNNFCNFRKSYFQQA